MAKIKTTHNAKCWWGLRESGSLIHCSQELQNCTNILENCLVFLEKLNIQLPQNIAVALSWRNRDLHLCKKNLYMNAYSSLIHNNPKPETIQMAFNQWMVEQIMVYLQYRLLLNIKGNKSLNESPEHYAMWKKPLPKGCDLLMQHSFDKITEMGNTGPHEGLRGVWLGGDWSRGTMGIVQKGITRGVRVMEMFRISTVQPQRPGCDIVPWFYKMLFTTGENWVKDI